MGELILNVYDDEDKVVKTSKAEIVDLKFGSIRRLMKLLNIDDMNNTAELFKTVYGVPKDTT